MSYADDYAREEQRLADKVMLELWRECAGSTDSIVGETSHSPDPEPAAMPLRGELEGAPSRQRRFSRRRVV